MTPAEALKKFDPLSFKVMWTGLAFGGAFKAEEPYDLGCTAIDWAVAAEKERQERSIDFQHPRGGEIKYICKECNTITALTECPHCYSEELETIADYLDRKGEKNG